MGIVKVGRALLSGFLLLTFVGCATLDVTQKKTLAPAGEKQPVTLGVQAVGDSQQKTVDTPKGTVALGTKASGGRLVDALDTSEDSFIKASSGRLFDKVVLLPKESESMEPKEINSAYKVDYILSVGVGGINVSHNLNPIWFASFPMLFFKKYAPIVTFEPKVSLDVKLIDATNGAILMQKQVTETSTDHYAPKDPRPEVRKLISRTINNAMVPIMSEAQQSIAAARQGKKCNVQ